MFFIHSGADVYYIKGIFRPLLVVNQFQINRPHHYFHTTTTFIIADLNKK